VWYNRNGDPLQSLDMIAEKTLNLLGYRFRAKGNENKTY
jgi:hypothetical protein